MKMKGKILACVTSAVLLSATIPALAACGGAESIKGYEVTEEQWEEAFDLLDEYETCDRITILFTRKVEQQGTLDMSAVGGKKMTGGGSVEEKMTATINFGKQKVTNETSTKLSGDWKMVFADEFDDVEPGEESTTYYAERNADWKYTIYQLNEEGDEWDTHESSHGIVPAIYDLLSIDGDQLGSDFLDFENFEFSAKENGYVLKASEMIEEINKVVIKFNEEGLLAGVYYDYAITTTEVQNDSYPVFSREEVMSVVGDMTISYTAKNINMP